MTFDMLCPKVLIQKPLTVKDAFLNVPIGVQQNEFSGKRRAIAERMNPFRDGSDVIKGQSFNLKRLAWDKPSRTILKSIGRHDSSYGGGLIHPEESRHLTIPELKRIGFFPDKYCFIGSFEMQWERIGNSVPPGLMRAIALNIKHYLFHGDPLIPYSKSMSYLDILEATWKDHLTPKGDDAPTVISTFAGSGGSSLGYSMAGYKELLAVEMNNNAVETFKLNFPHIPVFHGDIANLSVEQCMKFAGLTESGELDVFDGSPPCQGFSTAGKRQMSDDRNTLFHEYVRLLRGLQPKAFIMENVSGMVKGKMKIIFAEILRELKASGYEVKVWLLNSKYFYVPQSRERLIFIGVRKDFWESLNL